MLSEPRITLIAQMGCDAPRPFVSDRCLYRGLRVLSEPRIGVIARMGCEVRFCRWSGFCLNGDYWDLVLGCAVVGTVAAAGLEA